MKRAILPSPIIIGEGTFRAKPFSRDCAANWLASGPVENFCGHQTTKILGIEPATERRDCIGYDEALVLKPKKRLEFGREYSAAEVEQIGVDYLLIRHDNAIDHRRIGQILSLAAQLPTGLADPQALEKLGVEIEELEREQTHGDDHRLDIIAEASDCVYYAIKACANGLVRETWRDGFIETTAGAVGVSASALLDCAIAKYTLRARPGNPKDPGAERAAIGRVARVE
jgi:hypothetical protein